MYNKTDNSTENSLEFIHDTSFEIATVVLMVVGIIGNLTTILVIKCREDFHNATYTTIALLAFVDLVM